MALFPDYNPTNLQDTLQKQAQSRSAGIQDQYTQARKRLVAQQAASGRLMSGVADYPLTDLDTSEGSALSGVQDSLANALAGVPAEDYLNQNQFQRQLSLAKEVGSLMQPSTLDEVMQGIGGATKIGATVAGFGVF